MQTVTLGRTGLRVSRMGFGGIPIQRADAATARAIVERMAQLGVNYIDTARGYTVSEGLLGEALTGLRDRFVLATKSMARTREAMEADVETSLANLRTDYIDMYQVHNPSIAELEAVCAPGGALEALQAAKAAGKIGHIGLTAHTAAVLERALSLDWVETVMFPYNAVETQGEALIRQAAERGLGVVCMKPLAGGAIEDATLALRFAASEPAVTVIIPGIKSVDELEQDFAALNAPGPLTDAERAQIEALRRTLGTQFCRRCDYCQPCTVGLKISGLFLAEGYLRRYGLRDWAIQRYDGVGGNAGDCIGCGACEARCPYELPIRQMLKRCAGAFDEAKAAARAEREQA